MKKVLSLVLALAMALSLCIPTAFAEENSLNNFVKNAEYTNNFTDVSSGHWAASVIKTCYEYGLMNGTSATQFSPKGDLTVAQALVMACRVHEIYTTGQSTLSNGSPWYQPYVDYALANGIVNEGDFTNFNAKITRAEMAHVFYNSLNGRSMPAYNYIEYIPDVSSSDAYASEIMTLYKGGILTGSDVYGTFYPDNTITRQEAAAIIARVAIPAERKSGHVLLSPWSLDDYTEFAMPQGSEEVDSGSDSSAAVATPDGKYALILNWSYDEAYAGLNISVLSPTTLEQSMLNAFTSDGMVTTNTKTDLVQYGSCPAYRIVTDYIGNDISGSMVIIAYIANSELIVAAYISTTENSQATLYSIANQLTLGGQFVDKKL